MLGMKQHYHTIIKPTRDGWFVGWVEEVPGTITYGRSLEECRRNLRDALAIMLDSIRSEARIGLDDRCLQEMLEIEVEEPELATA
jgi:predicted RNase H-like HicB family nuclease